MPNLGPMELAIIALVILLLFGGTKLAGLGKNAGRALREFKEETQALKAGEPLPKSDAAEGGAAGDAKPGDTR